jgi:hypothetical protein
MLLAFPLTAQTGGSTRDILVLNFATMSAGALPVSTGSLELVDKAGSRMLRASGASSFRVSLPQGTVLPENFTLEFDVIPKECCSSEDLAFQGTLTADNTFARVSWGRVNQLVNGGGDQFTATMRSGLSATLPGQLTHVVATFEGGLLKVYTNGERLYTNSDRRFPRGNLLQVFLNGDDEGKGAVYLARLRVAEGIATPGVTAVMATSTGTGMLSSPATASSSQAVTSGATAVTGLSVTLDAQAKATLKWAAVPDATAYAAMRWNVNDLTCCKNLSPLVSTTQWDDGTLADGTYGYRVYATAGTATVVGETRVTVKNGAITETIANAGSGSIASPSPSPAPPPAPPPPPPPPTLDGANAISRLDRTASASPAFTLSPITGTPALASLHWSPVSGAYAYVVTRREASNPVEQRTPDDGIRVTNFDDAISNPTSTYSYQVSALVDNGSYSGSTVYSAWVSYTPPPLVNPTGFVARQISGNEVMLTWQKVDGASAYRLDGAGIPMVGLKTTEPFFAIPGLQTGTQLTWKVATVYGENLFDLRNQPTATLTLPTTPWPVPWLTLRNGAGGSAEQLAYYTQLRNSQMFGSCTKIYPWDCMNALSLILSFPVSADFQRTGLAIEPSGDGSPVYQAVLADQLNMGAGRRVYCAQSGTSSTLKTLCWAGTFGPEPGTSGWNDPAQMLSAANGPRPNRGWTYFLRDFRGTLFAAFKTPDQFPAGYGSDEYQYSAPKTESVFDTQGPKRLPHACLACHGGRYDVTSASIVDASLIPLDPSVLLVPNREGQEESIRQINMVVLNSNPSPAVAAYIRGLYRGTPDVPGTKADDNYIPAGWSNAPDLYRKVVKPYCQGCHLQQQPRIDFASYDNFVTFKASILTAICTTRTMPHSEAALLSFWRDSKAEFLPDYLTSALGLGKCP